jgi:hypothetical protein
VELFTQDSAADSTAGVHNSTLATSMSRIIEGGTWKRQRVVVILPSALTIPAKVALSHWNLIFPPNQAVYRYLALGCEVGDAYTRALDEIMASPELSQWEYVLTLEHDNMPPPDGVIRLIKRMEERPDLHCIGGLYWTKGEGGVPQIWGDVKDPVLNYRPQAPEPGKLVECCGTGMGFNLWRMSMFRELAKKPELRPLFETKCGVNGVGTQDLSFWSKVRPLGYRCAIDCDVLVGHHDHSSGITW